MPTPSKVQPPRANSNGPPPKKAPAGSLLAAAIPVGEMPTPKIKFVIYGQNRVGKKHLACLFPKPLLLISFEPTESGGATTVKKFKGVDFLRVTSKAVAVGLAREELPKDKNYATVVLDSSTSLQDVILKELLGLDEIPVQLNWGTVSE